MPALVSWRSRVLASWQRWRTFLFWRSLRVLRVTALAVAIYGAGKAAGHVEVLRDPEKVRRALIWEHIQRTHVSETGREAGFYKPFMKSYRRVARVANRILQAARDVIREDLALVVDELARKRAELEVEESLRKEQGLARTSAKRRAAIVAAIASLEEREAELRGAQDRLAGNWQWVVTTSDSVNAFVTPVRAGALGQAGAPRGLKSCHLVWPIFPPSPPRSAMQFCPRCIFVLEGLLTRLDPNDDELAMVLAHELAHVIHDHGPQQVDMAFEQVR